MSTIYHGILSSRANGTRLLAVLLDPDKVDMNAIPQLATQINASPATHIFVGGSSVSSTRIDELVFSLKKNSSLPVVLFPGNPSQIAKNADGILFLSLLSGRNPDFLIGHHVTAAPVLRNSNLEIIPTGYLLIESGSSTAVENISRTKPLLNIEEIVNTAIASEMLGHKLLYLEAGSGAKNAVSAGIVSAVASQISIPLIVGGGITSRSGIDLAFSAGADLVVIGTAFENDRTFFRSAFPELTGVTR